MADEYGTFTAACYIVYNMLGSGINYMPAAFNNSGVLFALGILFMVALMTSFSIYALLRCSSKCSGKIEITYANLSFLSEKYHRPLKVLIDISMAVASFFTTLSFQKYIQKLLFLVAQGYFPNQNIEFYKYLEILLLISSTILLTGLSLIRNLSIFKYLSVLSVGCVISLMGVLSALYFSLTNFISTVPVVVDKTFNYSFSLSFFILAMSVQANIPRLFNNIRDKRNINLFKIALSGAILGFLFYAFAGLLGYGIIGDCIRTQDLMKIFLDQSSPLNVFLRTSSETSFLIFLLRKAVFLQGLAGIIILTVGFPMQLLPVTSYLKEIIPVENPLSMHFHSAVVLTEITAMTAINLIPNISLDLIYGLLGPTIVGFLSFFFPFLFYSMLKNKSFYKIALSSLIMCLSIGYCFYGVYSAVDTFLYPIIDNNDLCYEYVNQTAIIEEIN